MEFICDNGRHLICLPYSIANLHVMAQKLGIGRHWFHAKPNLSHYDIPKKRVAEIQEKCRVVTSKEIIEIIRQATR
jgi:hypothetical protein